IGSFEADWQFPSVPTRPAIDVFVAWDTVAADAYAVTRDPTSYDTLALFRIALSRTDVVDALALGTIEASITGSWTTSADGLTESALSELRGFDPTTDYQVDPTHTFLLALCDVDGDRLDIRTGLVLEPNAAQSGTFVAIPNGGSATSFVSKLDGDVIRTASGYDAYTVDWSGVTTDGYGQPFDADRADRLFVGWYTDVDEADDVASRILDLDATAAGWWTMPTGGATAAALGDATGADGAFPGFGPDGVYVVGVACSTCLAGAPLWIAGLDVRDGG
ncbi:MAG: hypothetical protein ABMB14_05105, partial [Myxococcota bacterium]